MTHVLVEACVTSVDEAVGAERVGAHRLELCVDLEVGGLTPPESLVRAVKEAVSLPVFVMVRPRAGSFHLSPDELTRTFGDIERMKAAGADGVVLGFLRPDGSVDVDATTAAVEAARPLPVTFHRAFDEVPDPEAALEALVGAGVQRVLTGGGGGAARDNAETLAALLRQADGRMEILVGGRVRGDHARHLAAFTGARELHARAEAVGAVVRSLRVS